MYKIRPSHLKNEAVFSPKWVGTGSWIVLRGLTNIAQLTKDTESLRAWSGVSEGRLRTFEADDKINQMLHESTGRKAEWQVLPWILEVNSGRNLNFRTLVHEPTGELAYINLEFCKLLNIVPGMYLRRAASLHFTQDTDDTDWMVMSCIAVPQEYEPTRK
jgi:hypothetical protein